MKNWQKKEERKTAEELKEEYKKKEKGKKEIKKVECTDSFRK